MFHLLAGHEASLPSPAAVLGPPVITPPSSRRQTAHLPWLDEWQRSPSNAATGRGAPQNGCRRGQRRLRSTGRKHHEVSPEEEPGSSPPAPARRRQRGGGGSGYEDRGAAAETQRRAAALHRPDLPPAEEYDPDGQDGEPERAGSAQPQSARRGGEVNLCFLLKMPP